MHPSCDWRVVCVLHGLVKTRGSGVACGLWRVHARGIRSSCQHVGRRHSHMLAEVVNTHAVVLWTSWFENLGLGGAVVAIGPDAVELEADARGAGPGVGGGRVTLDFPPSTSFTCSHDCQDQLVPAYGRNEMVRMARTLEALMAVVLVHEDIICEMVREPNHTVCARFGGGGRQARTLLGFSWLVVLLGRKAEIGHLGALWEQPADCWVVRHGDGHAVGSLGSSILRRGAYGSRPGRVWWWWWWWCPAAGRVGRGKIGGGGGESLRRAQPRQKRPATSNTTNATQLGSFVIGWAGWAGSCTTTGVRVQIPPVFGAAAQCSEKGRSGLFVKVILLARPRSGGVWCRVSVMRSGWVGEAACDRDRLRSPEVRKCVDIKEVRDRPGSKTNPAEGHVSSILEYSRLPYRPVHVPRHRAGQWRGRRGDLS